LRAAASGEQQLGFLFPIEHDYLLLQHTELKQQAEIVPQSQMLHDFVRHASEINETGAAETVGALGVCRERPQYGYRSWSIQ
jgi:hypothetical protein